MAVGVGPGRGRCAHVSQGSWLWACPTFLFDCLPLLRCPLRSPAGWPTLRLSQGHLRASPPAFSLLSVQPLDSCFLPALLTTHCAQQGARWRVGRDLPGPRSGLSQAGRKVCSGGKKQEVQQAQLVLLAEAFGSPVSQPLVMSARARAPLGPTVPLPAKELGGWALPHFTAGISDP